MAEPPSGYSLVLQCMCMAVLGLLVSHFISQYGRNSEEVRGKYTTLTSMGGSSFPGLVITSPSEFVPSNPQILYTASDGSGNETRLEVV